MDEKEKIIRIYWSQDYLEYLKWVTQNIMIIIDDIIPTEIWKQTTLEEQESILFGYWCETIAKGD